MSQTRIFQRLRASELRAWLAQHPEALLLDARDAQHHARGHLPGSVRLDGRNHERLLMQSDRHRPVFIYCYHGHASQTYADMFVDFGFSQVWDLVGGWEAWQQQAPAEGLPPAGRAEAAMLDKLNAMDPASRSTLLAWLQAHGFADPQTAGAHGNTPLMTAAWRGELAVVKALLGLGVDLRAVNGDGNNALWLGCVSNQPELVITLAQAGVPLDHVNATGATSLMYAASSSKPEIVRVLLALGADPLVQTQDDYTALDMAGDITSLQLLRAATRGAVKATA